MVSVSMRTVTATWIALSVLCASLDAQGRWYRPYRRGVDAFEARHFQEAIEAIEAAVAIDPKPEANKYVEGGLRVDYFPYYYLSVAYLNIGRRDKAKENYDKALSNPLKNQFRRNLELVKADITPPAPPALNAAFEPAIQRAESAVANRQFREAIDAWDVARSLEPEEFARRGLPERHADAVRGLVTEGMSLLQQGRLDDARGALRRADQAQPGQPAVADSLREIQRRETEYTRLTAAADQDRRQDNFAAAHAKYLEARALHPQRFESDALPNTLRDVEQRLGQVSLRTSAEQAFADRRYKEALDGARAVLQRSPNDATAQQLEKRAESMLLFDEGLGLVAQGQYQDADRRFAAAAARDSGNKAAVDRLAASRRYLDLTTRAETLIQGNQIAAAQPLLEEARSLDPRRFERSKSASARGAAPLEGLPTATGAFPVGPAQPRGTPPLTAARNGVVALLKGDARAAVPLLEGGVKEMAASASSADVSAYLAVAYATLSLSTTNDLERVRWRNLATRAFRGTLQQRPDYRLSDRLVSPKVRELLDAARTGR